MMLLAPKPYILYRLCTAVLVCLDICYRGFYTILTCIVTNNFAGNDTISFLFILIDKGSKELNLLSRMQ